MPPKSKKQKHQVVMQFESKAHADAFFEYMCEQGEQDYWQYVSEQENVEEVRIDNFDYWAKPEGGKQALFMGANFVNCTSRKKKEDDE